MKNNIRFLVIWVLVFLGLASVNANAALVDRGGGLIYDTDLNITWLSNANVNGRMTWDDAMTWAANFSYYDSVRNVTYTDWRLPTVTDTGTPGCNYGYSGTDCGFNIDTATSEMGHLFYDELGNKATYDTSGVKPQPGWGLVNKGPFTNLLGDTDDYAAYYWSGTESAPDTNFVWYFSFKSGGQNDNYGKSYDFYAMVVRPGDVSAVPLPATFWLFGSGLVALLGFIRKHGISN